MTNNFVSIAPYNFIPLNDFVIPSEIDEQSGIDFSLYSNERYTGHIELELEAKTPLYIRNLSEILQNGNPNPSFFSPGGELKIPGSSLRGMIRTLIEIVTYSKFKKGSQFENQQFYYRAVADPTSLRNEYNNILGSINGGLHFRNLHAGYLRKQGLQYFIYPAKKINGTTYQRRKLKGKLNPFSFEEINGKTYVHGGPMRGKRKVWVVNEKDTEASPIEISQVDIEAYRNDHMRMVGKEVKGIRKDGDLIHKLDNEGFEEVPCFYIKWQDREGNSRISFGHIGTFRLAYRKTVDDFVPEGLKGAQPLDMAEAIFGRTIEDKKDFDLASRVYFEDLFIDDKNKNATYSPKIPKILSSPKPTAFQHYLEQPMGVSTRSRNLKHWNSNETRIRGYKQYWHKDILEDEYVDKHQKINKVSNVHTIIQPVKKGTTFKGRIRFENLTEVELGALMFVLKLPKAHYHKLGMAKPLGLGTVKITPRLYTINFKQRFRSLFAKENLSWEEGLEEQKIDNFIQSFERYILDYLGNDNNRLSLWDVHRIKHLKHMLSWENTNTKFWKQKVDYTQVGSNSYRYRNVLPQPLQVKR